MLPFISSAGSQTEVPVNSGKELRRGREQGVININATASTIKSRLFAKLGLAWGRCNDVVVVHGGTPSRHADCGCTLAQKQVPIDARRDRLSASRTGVHLYSKNKNYAEVMLQLPPKPNQTGQVRACDFFLSLLVLLAAGKSVYLVQFTAITLALA